jgi:hypothetical protein
MKKLKKFNWINLLILTFVTCIIFSACEKKDNTVPEGVPVLGATAIRVITTTMGFNSSDITAIGNSAVTAKGFCWSTSNSPTINDNVFTHSGSNLGVGNFAGTFDGFNLNTTYYIRSWATNGQGYRLWSNFSF